MIRRWWNANWAEVLCVSCAMAVFALACAGLLETVRP